MGGYRFYLFPPAYLLLALTPLFCLVSAGTFLDAGAVPQGTSSGCIAALTAETACKDAVADLRPSLYYPLTKLQSICNPACSSALASYHAAVVSSCTQDTYETEERSQIPVAMFSELIRYAYNLTCLTESGRFCNNVAAAFAAAADPGAADVPGGLPAGGDFGEHDTSNRCDACLLDSLRFQAGSPYYEGPVLRSRSIYEAKTSSCGVANKPLVPTSNSLLTQVFSIKTTTLAPAPTSTCAGSTYTVQSGDDCHSISLSEGISTEWLIIDNKLPAFCHEFPTNGTLCLVNKCAVYTVAEDDTCKSIARAHSITEAQLLAWNPSINSGCYNLVVGDQVCVKVPGQPYVTPPPTTLAPTIPNTPAPVPTNVAIGTNTRCGTYVEVKVGDYCNQLVMKYGISMADFVFLNTAINQNCTNLYALESYCVQAVGDINTYSGRPGYGAPTLTMTGTIDDTATNLPDASFTYPEPSRTPLPLALESRQDCAFFVDSDDVNVNLTGTYFRSQCEFLSALTGVTLEDLQIWNPSLDTGVSRADDNVTRVSQEGMAENCTATVDVRPDGLPTCQAILDEWYLLIEDFYEWNPSVGPDCGGMWAGYHYCVRVEGWAPPPEPSSTVSATPTSTPTSGPTPPGPVQEGQPTNCNKWHLVAAGDDCSIITSQYSISFDQFLDWNPAVSDDCVNGFWGGYAYCVGVSSAATPTTTSSATQSSTTLPTSTNTPVPAPEPNQAGNAVANCNKYAEAQSGDWCAAFIERNGLNAANFYSWNTVLGPAGPIVAVLSGLGTGTVPALFLLEL
ncbi:lysM domain-containing protein ARB_00327 [Colletotrichum liriopes]|uniref:LysM domain-containing protein ARB_00327 n=1 Tax=Colletotrichum liriopes TaxID=708192 RepID=A0AA37GMJ8_9PEZI|nr:lysM domain-containing protein ARB_00327 [Colletotrichum liriopes]